MALSRVVADAIEQTRPQTGIGEIRRPHLHRIGAGDDELERVACAGEAEQTALLQRFKAEGLRCKALVS